jgi:hypothetical protein
MLASCEDDLPTGYQEQYVIEAFLIEGQMIRDLRIVRSFPVNEPFDYEEALVRDATVAITDSSGSVFPLTIAPEGQEGYFYPDSSYKVQKNTSYTLNVSFADGRSAKGTAFVPDTFSWTQQAPDILNYPTEAELDTAEVFISWTPQPNFALGYLLQSRALDTLEYGIYLDPPTEEKNERVTSEFREDSFYDNTTTWGFLPSNQSVVVWTALRWYGLHEVSIYSADFNMLRWFLQARGAQQYNELLNTIEGDAVGCFGAASVIRDTTLFLFP